MAAARGGPWRPRIPEPRISVPGLRALRGSRARSGARFQGWGPPPAAEAGAWKLGAVSVPRTFRRPGAFWLRRWPRVLKAALRGSGVSGAIGVVRGAPVLVPPSTPVPSQLSSSLFLPFIAFALLVSPFFNPYVCAVYTRSWASGKPAPQESGFCPVVGPALLKARLRRRQKSGVRGSGSQPWSGTSAFTILSPSRVSPSMTWRNSLCLQK